MSEKPDDPKPGGDDAPHGLEEIRQEIAEVGHQIEEAVEEAVEHVPKPIRWTVGKLVRLVLLSLLGLMVVAVVTAILYVANRTEWAAQELALIVNQTLASRSDIMLEVGDLKGNPLTGVRILRPRVRFREGDAPPLLEAPALTLRYSAWALATGGRGPIVIEIDHPQFQLGRKADGSFRLPTWNAGPKPRGRATTRDFVVRIRDGSLLTPDTTMRIAGLELEALATSGGPAHVEVRSLRWREGPFGSVLRRLRADIAGGDSTRLTVRELITDDLRLAGRAAWKSGEQDARVHADIGRIRWRWLARVFRNGTFDVPGEGRVTIDARGWKRWNGAFATQAVWDSLPLDAHGNLAWDGERLRLDPMIGHSPAGDLDGAVFWSKQGWQVGGGARHANPAHWEVMGLRGWPEGELNGRFRYWVDTRAVPHARLAATLAPSEWARWRADSGTVAIDFTPVGPDSFVVHAIRRGGDLTLRAITQPDGWRGDYTVARFPLDEWPDGRASGLKGTLVNGHGVAEGKSGGLRVTGTLDGAVTDWLGIHTAHWRLTDVQGALLPVPDLTANARLTDLFFLGVHWDSAGVAFKLGDGTVSLPGVTASAGDTTMRLDARVDWGKQGWNLTADHAELESSRFHWTAEPPLRLAGDKQGVRFERLIGLDGDARLAMEGRWAVPGGGGRYDWTARVQRLDLSRLGLPMDWGLAGTADATLRVTGQPGDAHWTLEGAARAPGVQGHRADSLRATLGGGPSRVEFSDVTLLLDGGRLEARGEVSGMRVDWPDTLTGNGITHWIADAAHWTGTVRAERLPIDRLERMVPAAKGWKGMVTGSMDLRGSPGEPDVVASVDAQPLAWGDYRLNALTGRARYHDRRLEVPELTMTRAGVVSTITGTMPLVLAVGRKPSVPDTPMEWKVDLPSGDLAVLPVFVPQIGSASGKLDVHARLAGTPRKPDLSGRASIRDGKARMAGREEVLESISADLTLDESRITLDSLTARQRLQKGLTGSVSASGAIDLDGLSLQRYAFTVDLRDFTALESGIYAAIFDGRFKVTNGPRIGGTTLPFVESLDPGVELQRAVVLFDFANQSEVDQVSTATKPLYWTYRIHLNATDKLFWQPQDANIEFSADLRMEQTRDELIIFGDMAALRGTYYYLTNKFDVSTANLTFDNVGGVDPKLDIEAVTQVDKALIPTVSTASGKEDITVQVTGRAREPVIAFSSSPDVLDQPTLLSALTYGQAGRRGQGSGPGQYAGNYADNYFTRAINRQLSSDLSRAFQGYISDLEFARESGGLVTGQGDVIVRVGVPLSRNVSVRYGQSLHGTATRPVTGTGPTTNPLERDIEAEYRLNRFFYFTTELTQRRLGTGPGAGLAAPEFNVNLKARWEY